MESKKKHLDIPFTLMPGLVFSPFRYITLYWLKCVHEKYSNFSVTQKTSFTSTRFIKMQECLHVRKRGLQKNHILFFKESVTIK